METTIVYWGNIGIMENKMEATTLGGCQNYDPFLGTLNIRCCIIIGIQKGTIRVTQGLGSFSKITRTNIYKYYNPVPTKSLIGCPSPYSSGYLPHLSSDPQTLIRTEEASREDAPDASEGGSKLVLQAAGSGSMIILVRP